MLDLWLKRTDPVVNIQTIKKVFPDKPIIIFTSEESSEWKENAGKQGVDAYVTKSHEVYELKNIVKQIYNGWEEKRFQNKLLISMSIKDPSQTFENKINNLSTFQKEVIKNIKEGLCLKEIALETGKSISYVNRTVMSLRKTFSSKTNAELIRLLCELEEVTN